uniref:Uncharacterized protein n=1 Tax=Arundo donax TaxID=35708 RepID=A0A0A9FT73_ARUDO
MYCVNPCWFRLQIHCCKTDVVKLLWILQSEAPQYEQDVI